jgi:hypothetical protein
MQLSLHPASDRGGTLASFRRRPPDLSKPSFCKPVFANWFSQIRETKNRANGLPREDHYKPDKSSEWSALEKPVAPPPTCCLPEIPCPEIRFRTFSHTGAGEGI